MFPELTDFGLIFISLAIFGYIISDTFKSVRNFGIPDTYKNDIEKFFHYISIGIIALSYLISFTFLVLASPNPENFITKSLYEFINVFEKLHNAGILSDYYHTLIPKVYILLVFPSLALLTIWTAIIFLSFFIKFSQAYVIRVFLKGNEQPIEALELISESDQFFYIAKQKRLWAAIRKEDVKSIEAVYMPSLFDKLLQKNILKISERIRTWKAKRQSHKWKW
jgi:hypothetical protein